MKNKQDVEKLAETTLASLDNLQHVEANEFLYGKVINRMQMREALDRKSSQRLMLKLAVALVAFIGINAASFYVFEQQQHKTHPKSTGATGAAAFAQEYSLQNSSYNY
ncbi:MAG: hypothetical protein ACXVAY_04970 [Mucilaginibacter sp.]